MKEKNFVIWLKGFLEGVNSDTLSQEQLDRIKAELRSLDATEVASDKPKRDTEMEHIKKIVDRIQNERGNGADQAPLPAIPRPYYPDLPSYPFPKGPYCLGMTFSIPIAHPGELFRQG